MHHKTIWVTIARWVALLGLLLTLPLIVDSNTVKAAGNFYAVSGSAADVQTAINTALASDGGNVYIPSGNWSWSTNTVSWTGNNIKLLGTGANTTYIYTTGTGAPISATGNNTRISGFHLEHADNTGTNGIKILGDSSDFRVDNMRIEGYGSEACIYVTGRYTTGVIDHNYLRARPLDNQGYGIIIRKSTDWWPASFFPTTEMQETEAVFIEDNTIVNSRHAIAATNGAYYVFRYNYVSGGFGNSSAKVDMHGVVGAATGTRYAEVYNNTIELPTLTSFSIGPRGGDGVIYDNTVNGYTWAVAFFIESGQGGNYPTDYPIAHQVREYYVWDNGGTRTGEATVSSLYSSNLYIQKDRDWFNYALDGYTGYTYPHPLTQEVEDEEEVGDEENASDAGTAVLQTVLPIAIAGVIILTVGGLARSPLLMLSGVVIGVLGLAIILSVLNSIP